MNKENILYVAYDDEGIIKEGTKQECLDAIRDWTITEEAEKLYDEDTLGNIYRFFNRKDDDNTFISTSGFAIAPKSEELKKASSSPVRY